MSNRKDVYTVVEREGQKAFWLKIGTAFVNKDESLNVYLNALPISGELNIREPKPKESSQEA
jgi:hypothetical protein